MGPPSTKRRKTDSSRTVEATITDPRFANIQSDPRYRLPGKRQKIKVDKRFAKALQDDDFARKSKVDRYGRPLETDSEKKRLKRKYEFEDEENKSDYSDEPDDDSEVQAELKRLGETRDLLREGRGVGSSEDGSSSEESSDEEEEEDEVDEVGPGIQDQDVPMGEVSSRLAVVNLDWDNIRAEDLMAVFQSFLPATGRLLKVTVYPSEFGKERMEREEMEGPPKEIFAKAGDDEENVTDSESEVDEEDIKKSIIKPDDGSEFDSTALRQYQLDRLRYYYAVLTFSSVQAAKAIYDAVDGAEYLTTANFFDLRFVPDETDFSDDKPREECERIPSGYKPNDFVTDALQHSKVKLTWDAEDGSRKEAQARAFRGSRQDIDENDLKAYLGSDSDSEDDEDGIEAEGTSKSTNSLSKKDAERQRMRALLGLAPEPVKTSKKDKKGTTLGNIQITFSSGLSGAAADDEDVSDENNASAKNPRKKRSVFENSPEPDETTMEKYVRKERERKQRRKEKMKAGRGSTGATADVDAQNEADDATANPEDLGFDDPFFTEAALDTKSATKQRKEDRVKRRKEREADEAASAQQRAELEKVMASADAAATPKDPSSKGRTVKHFDMAEIEKAEKALSKGKKALKKLAREKNKNKGAAAVDPEAVLAADDFTVDTADPRFARLYENHEFAIDPTNPRYKGTRGMKALLEEGRKRRAQDKRVDGGADRHIKGSKTKTSNSGGEEVMGLVEKIKRRQK